MNEHLRDALDRAAGPDPQVDLTEQVWAQGRVVRRRRHATQAVGGLAAAGVLVGALWAGGGLLSDPEALPGPADPPTDDAAVRTIDRDTEEVSTGDDDVAEPSVDTDRGTQEEDTTEPVQTPVLPTDPCTTPYPDPVLLGEGLPEATTDTATQILELAAACDLDGLAALAQADQTFLSFGVADPAAAFTGEESSDRAAAIVAALTLFEPTQDVPDAPYRWPGAVESEEDWELVVDSGLHSQEEVDLLRASGTGYAGWRVGVDAAGTWSFMVAGD